MHVFQRGALARRRIVRFALTSATVLVLAGLAVLVAGVVSSDGGPVLPAFVGPLQRVLGIRRDRGAPRRDNAWQLCRPRRPAGRGGWNRTDPGSELGGRWSSGRDRAWPDRAPRFATLVHRRARDRGSARANWALGDI